MAFPYKHVVLIGGTAGIGKAMGDRLIESGVKVTVVGRRQDRLDDFVRRHGENKASAVAFDIGNLDKIPEFAAQITKSHPDVDCIFLNAGLQRAHKFSEPETVDLQAFNLEMHVNFTSFVALTHAFIPFLKSKETQTSLIYTTSNLAIVPAAPVPAYSASKAALNAFILCLREQLQATTNIKVIEVLPPAVQTELHDYLGVEHGRNIGMPLDVFTNEAYQGLVDGRDQIIIGSIGPVETVKEIAEKRRVAVTEIAKMMRQLGSG